MTSKLMQRHHLRLRCIRNYVTFQGLKTLLEKNSVGIKCAVVLVVLHFGRFYDVCCVLMVLQAYSKAVTAKLGLNDKLILPPMQSAGFSLSTALMRFIFSHARCRWRQKQTISLLRCIIFCYHLILWNKIVQKLTDISTLYRLTL